MIGCRQTHDHKTAGGTLAQHRLQARVQGMLRPLVSFACVEDMDLVDRQEEGASGRKIAGLIRRWFDRPIVATKFQVIPKTVETIPDVITRYFTSILNDFGIEPISPRRICKEIIVSLCQTLVAQLLRKTKHWLLKKLPGSPKRRYKERA